MQLHCFGRPLKTSEGIREALFSEQFISLGEAPFREPEKPAALRNGFERRLKNTIEKSDQSLPVIGGIRPVVMKGAGADVFCVKFGGVIHMEDVFSQFMVRREIVSADKTFWVEKLPHPRIAPVDGDGVHMKRVDEFLCTPPCPPSVFKSDVEAVAGEPIDFHLVAVPRR